MVGVDSFVVDVAIPTMAADLRVTTAEIESVIAIYLIAYSSGVAAIGAVFFAVEAAPRSARCLLQSSYLRSRL